MRPWHVRLPKRWLAELNAVRASYPAMQFHEGGGGSWSGSVDVRGKSLHVELKYSFDHPRAPPKVTQTHALNPLSANSYIQTHHQLIDGSICLYTKGQGPRSWRSEYTAKDVLDRFIEFMEVTEKNQHVPEFYSEPELVVGARSPRHYVIERSLAQHLTIPEDQGTWIGQLTADGRAVVVHEIQGRISEKDRLERWSFLGPFHPQAITGRWRNVGRDDKKSWRELLPSRAAFPETLPLILARGVDECSANALLAIENCLPSLETPEVFASAIINVIDSSKTFGARNQHVVKSGLADWTLIFVGLGSLGSQIAIALASAGVQRFVLFDPEVLRPENISRHAADLRSLFRPKVDAIAELIRARCPFAAIDRYFASPLWDSSIRGGHASQAWSGAIRRPKTLAIISTAEEETELEINRFLCAEKTPGLYASVLGDAEHGRVFRVLPGETGCYECLLAAQRAFPDRQPRFEARDRNAYRTNTLPGLGLDVGQVALLAARMALQTIARLDPSALSIRDGTADHLLWSNTGGWVFDASSKAMSLDLPRALLCEACAEQA